MDSSEILMKPAGQPDGELKYLENVPYGIRLAKETVICRNLPKEVHSLLIIPPRMYDSVVQVLVQDCQSRALKTIEDGTIDLRPPVFSAAFLHQKKIAFYVAMVTEGCQIVLLEKSHYQVMEAADWSCHNFRQPSLTEEQQMFLKISGLLSRKTSTPEDDLVALEAVHAMKASLILKHYGHPGFFKAKSKFDFDHTAACLKTGMVLLFNPLLRSISKPGEKTKGKSKMGNYPLPLKSLNVEDLLTGNAHDWMAIICRNKPEVKVSFVCTCSQTFTEEKFVEHLQAKHPPRKMRKRLVKIYVAWTASFFAVDYIEKIKQVRNQTDVKLKPKK